MRAEEAVIFTIDNETRVELSAIYEERVVLAVAI